MQIEAKLVRIDRSKPFLRQWYSQGFRAVRLKLVDKSCRVCRSLRDAEFYIFNLLSKDNPLYRLTHPNCNCGLVPVDESHLKHKDFDEKIGYKLQVKKIDEPNAHIAPEKNEDIDKHKEEEQKEYQTKLDQTNKEIEKTEQKLEQVEKKEEEDTKEGEEPPPSSLKQYLNRYLDKLKNLVVDLKKKFL